MWFLYLLLSLQYTDSAVDTNREIPDTPVCRESCMKLREQTAAAGCPLLQQSMTTGQTMRDVLLALLPATLPASGISAWARCWCCLPALPVRC